MEDLINRLKTRVKLPLPGFKAQERMIGRVLPMPVQVPENARPGAVLCLLFPLNDELHILLMKRMEDKTAHSGQVSFPGGSYEQQDANYRATALREAQEEVGILSSEVEILSELTSLYIPVSNFNVYPFLAYSQNRPVYNLSHQEVRYVLEIPISELFHQDRKTIAEVTSPASPDVVRKVNAYSMADGTIIWGATAMILSEIEAILEDIGF